MSAPGGEGEARKRAIGFLEKQGVPAERAEAIWSGRPFPLEAPKGQPYSEELWGTCQRWIRAMSAADSALREVE